MATADQLRQRLLRDGRKLLAAAGHEAPVAVTVIVTAAVEVVSEAPPAARAATPPASADLPPVQAAILGVLSDTPASAKDLARLAGRRHNSYFRAALSSLLNAGLIRYSSRGYSRP